jgi:hypothetical protein
MISRSAPIRLRFLHTTVPTAHKPHVHWFRWAGEDPYGAGSLYKCRCGVARPGL